MPPEPLKVPIEEAMRTQRGTRRLPMAAGLPAKRALDLIALALPVGLAAMAGWSILGGDLRQDELLLLYRLVNYGPTELLLTPHGGHSLLTSNLAYVVLYRFFGIDARPWFALVLLTHLVNVFLLFRVILAFTGRRWLACAFACAWGGAVIHFGTLSWFAVYGHVLVTTCLGWILYDLAACGRRAEAPSGRTMARWVLLLLVAATSFGVGTSIAMAAAIASALLLPVTVERRRTVVVLSVAALMIPVVYVGQHLLYDALSGRPVAFGVRESIARSSARGLRLPEMLVSLYHLACSGVASLMPGPLLMTDLSGKFVGTSPLGPSFADAIRRLHIIGSIVLIPAILYAMATRALRRPVTGLIVLLVACYGVVAVWWVASGRADTVALLGLKARVDTVPRYHYAGTFIVSVLLAIVLDHGTRRWRALRFLAIALAAWLAVAVPRQVTTYRSLAAAQETVWHRHVLARISAAVEAQGERRVVYIENRPFRVWGRAYTGVDLPGWAGIYAIAHPRDEESGPRVRFIEQDVDLLRAVRSESGTRMAALLVAPDEVVQANEPQSENPNR